MHEKQKIFGRIFKNIKYAMCLEFFERQFTTNFKSSDCISKHQKTN